MESSITERLQASLGPIHLSVVNESSMHSVPPGSETHFKVVVVSDGTSTINEEGQNAALNYALQNVATQATCAEVATAIGG